ncbi:hypothetical protein HYALB_00008516 [Hymenoscyphus albidus]|uniref:small monomeric GTPase n=1 Tax=Hymenoscyphus albidus TaxID=595503 RepID=A0A9N9LWN3_9HELO|nr:hypothetical protein HYALB_00008516 [Hymenoscyphus albidus]
MLGRRQLQFSLFVDFYIPKADNIYQRTINIDGLSANLQVLDSPPVESSGQEIQDGEGFMLLYSITDRESFKYVRYLYDQILRMKGRNRYFTKENEPLNDKPDHLPRVVLVANKSDKETLRQVSSQEGRSLADKLNCKFCETSASENWKVEEAFYEILPPSHADKMRINRKSEVKTFIEDPHMNSGRRKAKRRVQIRWPTRSTQRKAGFKVIGRIDA